jgi:glutathione S-transferase
MPLQLIIGNKNYSSWSLRPWLAMKVVGIAFEETLISLDAPDFKARIKARSGAGKVPVLIDGDTRIWESLAILEYLAEISRSLAGRRTGPGPCARDRGGNARGLCATATPITDEHPSSC